MNGGRLIIDSSATKVRRDLVSASGLAAGDTVRPGPGRETLDRQPVVAPFPTSSPLPRVISFTRVLNLEMR